MTNRRAGGALDRAMWITWYDLPADGEESHLAWLHGTYIPRVLTREGVLWAAHYASEERESIVPQGGGKGRVGRHASGDAVPAGYRFILMFGAEVPYAFVEPTPRAFHAGLKADDRRMLAMRSGERSNILVEEARVDGPAAGDADGGPGPCIQLGSFNADSYLAEDDIADWYAHCRLPSLKDLPGCIGARKLVSVAGWAKHVALYEFTSLNARNENFVYYERAHPEMEAWSVRVVKHLVHAPHSSNVALRIWPK